LAINYGSLILVVLITGYNLFFIYRKLNAHTMLVRAYFSAANSIVASAAFGALVAQTYQLGLFGSIGTSLIFAVGVGVLSSMTIRGRQNPAINIVLFGWLGAILGAILGTMMYKSNKVILIIDTLFIIIMYLLQKLSEWKAGNEQHPQSQTRKASRESSAPMKKRLPPYVGSVSLAAAIVLAAGVIWFQQDEINAAQIGQPRTQTAVYDEQNDLQLATIEVTENGFIPQKIDLVSGTMIKAVFNVSPKNKTGFTLQSTDLDVSAPLKPGENIFLINDPQSGTYEFNLDNGKGKCTFIIVAASPEG